MLRGFEKIKTSINFSGFKLFSQDEKKKNRPNKKRMDLNSTFLFFVKFNFYLDGFMIRDAQDLIGIRMTQSQV